MDERATHERNKRLFVFWSVFCLGLWIVGLAVWLPLAFTRPCWMWWVAFGIFMGAGFFGFAFTIRYTGVNFANYNNERFTASPEAKYRAMDALRDEIPRWRNKAYLNGKTTAEKPIFVLTMDEIKSVYPHVTQKKRYWVEFDFGTKTQV